eukprot:s759_g21.t1
MQMSRSCDHKYVRQRFRTHGTSGAHGCGFALCRRDIKLCIVPFSWRHFAHRAWLGDATDDGSLSSPDTGEKTSSINDVKIAFDGRCRAARLRPSFRIWSTHRS